MATNITVSIETNTGADHLNLTLHGEESGDNPAFNSQQVERILQDVALRVRGMYGPYFGPQK